jgi:hypothetical protein
LTGRVCGLPWCSTRRSGASHTRQPAVFIIDLDGVVFHRRHPGIFERV